MCKNEYEKLCKRTNKTMIYCRLLEDDDGLQGLCVAQRYCEKKDKYIPNEQKKYCKNYRI